MLCKATLVVAFLLALNTLPCHSVIVEHVVEALPGWSGDLPTLQFSGYLKLSSSNEKHFFYWYVYTSYSLQFNVVTFMVIFFVQVCTK